MTKREQDFKDAVEELRGKLMNNFFKGGGLVIPQGIDIEGYFNFGDDFQKRYGKVGFMEFGSPSNEDEYKVTLEKSLASIMSSKYESLIQGEELVLDDSRGGELRLGFEKIKSLVAEHEKIAVEKEKIKEWRQAGKIISLALEDAPSVESKSSHNKDTDFLGKSEPVDYSGGKDSYGLKTEEKQRKIKLVGYAESHPLYSSNCEIVYQNLVRDGILTPKGFVEEYAFVLKKDPSIIPELFSKLKPGLTPGEKAPLITLNKIIQKGLSGARTVSSNRGEVSPRSI